MRRDRLMAVSATLLATLLAVCLAGGCFMPSTPTPRVGQTSAPEGTSQAQGIEPEGAPPPGVPPTPTSPPTFPTPGTPGVATTPAPPSPSPVTPVSLPATPVESPAE